MFGYKLVKEVRLKFTYKQKVKIINGFYRGEVGQVEYYSEVFNDYEVKNEKHTICVPEHDLEAI